MIRNNGGPPPTRFVKCKENDPRLHGANVILDGVEARHSMRLVRLLQRFRPGSRDERGRLMRPMGELSSDELHELGVHGFTFESADIPNNYWPTCNFQLGDYYAIY